VSYLIFFAWILLSILWSADVSLSIRTVKTFYLCLLGLLVGGAISNKEFDIFLKVYISIAFVICLLSAYQAFVLGGSFRPVGLFGDWNENGSYIVTALLPLSVLYVTNTKYSSAIVGLGVALFVFTIGLTQSRGAFLGLGIALVVFLVSIIYVPALRKRFVLLLTWMFAGLVVENVVSSGSVFRLLNSLQSGNVSSSRLSLWDTAFSMYLEAPFLGSGIGTLWGGFVVKRYETDAVPPYAPHNDYLQLLAEVGPIGLFLFCVFVFYLMRKHPCAEGVANCSSGRLNAFSAWLAIIAVLTHVFFNFHLYSASFLLIIGLFSGYLSRYTSVHCDVGIGALHRRAAAVFPRYFTYAVVVLLTGLYVTGLLSDYLVRRADQTESFDEARQKYGLASVIAPYSPEPYLHAGQAIVKYLSVNGDRSPPREVGLIFEASRQFVLATERSRYNHVAYFDNAELMGHHPTLFEHSDILKNYDMAIRLRPNSLQGYLSFSDYLSSIGMKYAAWLALEQAWGRWFSASNNALLAAYAEKLQALREDFSSRDDVDAVKRLVRSEVDITESLMTIDRGFWLR
jgi:O-antigen ligase